MDGATILVIGMEDENPAFESGRVENGMDYYINNVALQYGELKESDWKYGKIIKGDVTPEFSNMLLSMPKPQDIEIFHKMTPFFNVFLDESFQSSHYGTEIYIEEK